MHAVVVRVTIHDFDRGREMLEQEIVPRAKQAPGFVAGYWTRSAEGQNGMGIIVFESEEAARGAEQMVPAQPEEEAVTVESVEVREVVASA